MRPRSKTESCSGVIVVCDKLYVYVESFIWLLMFVSLNGVR